MNLAGAPDSDPARRKGHFHRAASECGAPVPGSLDLQFWTRIGTMNLAGAPDSDPARRNGISSSRIGVRRSGPCNRATLVTWTPLPHPDAHASDLAAPPPRTASARRKHGVGRGIARSGISVGPAGLALLRLGGAGGHVRLFSEDCRGRAP